VAAFINHAQYLPGQRIGGTLLGGRLGQPALDAAVIDSTDRNLVPTDVDACHRRSSRGQTKVQPGGY
jgi:hypothetical protein